MNLNCLAKKISASFSLSKKAVFDCLVFSSVALLLLSSCGKKKVETQDQKFCLTDSMMRIINFDTVGVVAYAGQLQLPGKVTYNDEKVVKIFPLVSGTVTDVKVQLGDKVQKGQVLAIIKSTEMAGYSNDFVNAKANVQLTKKALDAQQDLFKSGLASQRDLIQAQTDYQKAQSDFNRINAVLSVNGGGISSGASYIVKAPVSGFVVDKQVNPSSQIRTDNGNDLFMISDLRNVWVQANVFESDITKVALGQKVSITTLTYPDKVFYGTIDKVYDVLDPVNKTMKVRIQMDNKDYLLKPEMFANVAVKLKSDQEKIAIQSKAIIFDNSKNYVIIYRSKCDMESREVILGQNQGTTTYINSGLSKGDVIVSKNQLFIYQGLNQ